MKTRKLQHPLAEVFGYPVDNMSPEALRHRAEKLCPYNNKASQCTKVSVKNPLGVCSVYASDGHVAPTCPTRMREDWIIAKDAADFFGYAPGTYNRIPEVPIKDAAGERAGNIDLVLAQFDATGKPTSFGAVEVQTVYISGNVSIPFYSFLEDEDAYRRDGHGPTWDGKDKYPRPDYLSSSRKRLAPQIVYKGEILKAWNRKLAVVLAEDFFNTLPELPTCSKAEADIAWLLYTLEYDEALGKYDLTPSRQVYTQFTPAMEVITRATIGNQPAFLSALKTKYTTIRKAASPKKPRTPK